MRGFCRACACLQDSVSQPTRLELPLRWAVPHCPASRIFYPPLAPVSPLGCGLPPGPVAASSREKPSYFPIYCALVLPFSHHARPRSNKESEQENKLSCTNTYTQVLVPRKHLAPPHLPREPADSGCGQWRSLLRSENVRIHPLLTLKIQRESKTSANLKHSRTPQSIKLPLPRWARRGKATEAVLWTGRG